MTIDSFELPATRFLSNFFMCDVTRNHITYLSVEHAYQAAKATNDKDEAFVRYSGSPGQAKKRGRIITPRADWQDVKLSIMRELIIQKFTRHKHLGYDLLRTAPHELIEGNTWGDTYWGVCRGQGLNHLGNLLMTTRDTMLAILSTEFNRVKT